jgi:hypothetical protein
MATWGLYRHSNYEETPQGKQFRAFEQLASACELHPRQWMAALARWRHWTAKIMGDQYNGQLYDWMQPIYDNLIRQGYTEPRPKWSAWVKRQEAQP